MSQQQLDVLSRLFWTGQEIVEVSYHEHNGNLFVTYRDSGGNTLKRSYDSFGKFRELAV